ncbi:MAG: carbon-nitrogen hydrolase family protein [Pseudomonadota bacterium]
MIAAAQYRAEPANVAANIARHVMFARHAASRAAELIVFPELSITAYEPTQAAELCLSHTDPRLTALRDASRRYQITIAAGLPTRGAHKPRISQLFFTPAGSRVLYSKQILHADELAFFEPGCEHMNMPIGTQRVAPAICYEALSTEHAAEAVAAGATLYAASVAKNDVGVARAHAHFAQLSRSHSVAIIMANATGDSDGTTHAGRSATWGRDGELLASLDDQCEGLVLLDPDGNSAEAFELTGP